ncbi:hypothetical protein [Halpernia sp. GG3]
MKEKQLIVIKTKLKLMDGGYYAIKGFEYQIDKSILEVLSCSNVDEEIFIEQIQDINTNSFVIQVKYKEASKLVPSRIREPIIQLINEFIKDSNKYYILYCYFYDLNGYSDNVDLNFLNTILGIEREKYTPKSKNEFLLKFKLIFSETFSLSISKRVSQIARI